MKSSLHGALVFSVFLLTFSQKSPAFERPEREPLPNFDKRQGGRLAGAAVSAEQRAAVEQLRARLPGARVDFDPTTGSPKFVSGGEGFLSGPNGVGQAISAAAAAAFAGDANGATEAFLREYAGLFGFGPEGLDQARITREFVTAHNGLRTVVWQEQVLNVPVFEAVFISHTTARGELVNISSQFVPAPAVAAQQGAPNPAALLAAPDITAAKAVAIATRNVGEESDEQGIVLDQAAAPADPEKRQQFTGAGLKGKAEVKLVWLPVSKDKLQLCWEIVFTSATRGEMFRVLVDAQNGDAMVRQGLTEYITNATYRVYTSDSPSPFSPGYSTPMTNQPPVVPRTLVTAPALDTNASPSGWINDGGNETLGNNVDAHTDRNNDNAPDLPRPQGSPSRVFDFPLDLTLDPTNYSQAAVVQLFYVCNWMHDKLYQLGFTEAAGNFQSNNFGRGGLGNDPLQADAQDGGGVNNANMSTPSDGSPPRMQMYLWSGPNPDRDGDLDVEIMLHEYTHGLSNRRVGGGVGLSALQSRGMGEGWSDFYGLTLLSESGDDVNGVYAAGAYASYLIGPTAFQNYYFGIRRYPYTTDLAKNPLTLKDIDPAQADYCASGAPYNTGFFGSCGVGNASEVHNQGELWCVTLWEARANLITNYGWTIGNQLILQLVTDGMNFSPANPTFLQARDAIIQADLVDNAGANRNLLWAAFAKRGMGFSATSPDSSTTTGVQESFDVPDDLRVTPIAGFVSSGPVGGPFSPASTTYTMTNAGSNSLSWVVVNSNSWLTVSPTGGSLTPGGPATTVTVAPAPSATDLAAGIYSGTIWFTNLNNLKAQSRQVTLRVGQPDYYTELFDTTTNDLGFQTLTFTPDGSISFYRACLTAATGFPTDPTGGTNLTLTDDTFVQVTLSSNSVSLYGRQTNVFFIGSNGYLTFNSGDSTFTESFAVHFNRPRVSAMFHDLNPGVGGTVSWKQLPDRVAVTYLGVPDYGSTRTNNFQIEMFSDGRIRFTYLSIKGLNNLVGLSPGTNVPAGFAESDLSANGVCLPEVTAVDHFTWNQVPSPQVTNVPFTVTIQAQDASGGVATNFAGTVALSGSSGANAVPINPTTSGNFVQGVWTGDITVTALASNVILRADDGMGHSGLSNPFQAVAPTQAPVILSQPVGVAARQGTNVSFSIMATGAPPLSFQWRKNGVDLVDGGKISGAATPTLTITSIANKDAGQYSVLVTNPYGSALSSNATLTILHGKDGSVFALSDRTPRLEVAAVGGRVLILWPADSLWILETSTSLSADSWEPVTDPPFQVGDQYAVPVEPSKFQRFYRLRYSAK